MNLQWDLSVKCIVNYKAQPHLQIFIFLFFFSNLSCHHCLQNRSKRANSQFGRHVEGWFRTWHRFRNLVEHRIGGACSWIWSLISRELSREVWLRVWWWCVETIIHRGNVEIEVSCPQRKQGWQSTRICTENGTWMLTSRTFTSKDEAQDSVHEGDSTCGLLWMNTVCLLHFPGSRTRWDELLLDLQLRGTDVHFGSMYLRSVWVQFW